MRCLIIMFRFKAALYEHHQQKRKLLLIITGGRALLLVMAKRCKQRHSALQGVPLYSLFAAIYS